MFLSQSDLTDKVLTSLLNRCGENLRVLDLGARSQMLSEYSMTIIGQHDLARVGLVTVVEVEVVVVVMVVVVVIRLGMVAMIVVSLYQ